MTAVKRKQKVSLSLDADLIQELKAGGPLSPQVNEAIRARLGRRRRRSSPVVGATATAVPAATEEPAATEAPAPVSASTGADD